MKICECFHLGRRSASVLALLLGALASCGDDPAAEPENSDDLATPGPLGSRAPTNPDNAPDSPSDPDPPGNTEGNPVLGGISRPGGDPPAPNAPAVPDGTGTSGTGASGVTPSGTATGSGLEPIIPELNGACPEFETGSQQILGLDTEIVAGTPAAAKGPLLFTWHGTGGNGRQAMRQLPQSVQRDIVARGGLIIAPSDNGQVRSGKDVTFVLGVWYDGADLDYADQMVACAVQNHNIDPRQIYVTGCSAGGLMAGVMSLERSGYVAAATPNSGGITGTGFAVQDRQRIPAVMTMHGGANDTVIVNFGDTSRALAQAMTPLGAFVVECNHGIGHCGAPASLHENAWEFMLAHPFGTTPSPYAQGLPAEFPDFCTIQ